MSDTYRIGVTHATVNVNKQGRLVVPAELRRELGIEPGSHLVAYSDHGRLVIESWDHLADRLQAEVALGTPPGSPSMVDELIAERRMEGRAEAAELAGDEAAGHEVRLAWLAEADAAAAAGQAAEWYAGQAK